jgi:HEAT repeat protein
LARADADAAVPVLAEALDTTAPTSYGALAGLLKTAGEIGDERVFPALVKWMSHDSMSVRVEARDAFAAIGSRSPRLPIEYMADAPAGARSYVSLVFPQIGPKAVPHLCEALLTHRAPQARQGAAWALGHMRLAEGVPALLRALAEEKHPKVRGGAVWALGEIADPRAVAPLTPLLKDEDPETRTAAAVSLGQLADVGARDALIEALKDGVAQVRAAAALALGSIGDEGARAALIAVQKDRNGEVAGNAGRALRMLDGKKERAGDAN